MSDTRGDTPEGETNDQLVAIAAAEHYKVSNRQLAEWHRAGLLPTPQTLYGGKRGSASLYPPGTSQRLLALCASRKRHPHNNGDVAWDMWWQGWSVPMHFVRGQLNRVAAKMADSMHELATMPHAAGRKTSSHPRLTHLAQGIIDRADTVRITNPLMRGARKRTKSGNFPTFVRVLFEVAVGAFSGFDAANPETAAEDQAIIEKGLGLQRARKDHLTDAGPWLTGDIGGALQQVGPMMQQFPPGYDLEIIDDDELDRTRDEVRTFLNFMDSYSGFLGQSFGRGAFGLSVFGWMIRRMRPVDQALTLLYWRSCRAAGLGPNVDGILAAARQWNTVSAPLIRALLDLGSEMPAAREILSPQQMGKAVRNKRIMDYTLKALRALRETHALEIDAFFAKRPEAGQAVQAFEMESNTKQAIAEDEDTSR